MSELALFGGPKAIPQPFARYNSIGEEERRAVLEVLDSGVLSKFLGCHDPDFFGGPKVQAFEKAWAKAFDTPHAVSVNSATSGLIAALGAAGVAPGDEVVVSPWTMCASATAILVWNAIPVFADIEAATFNLDPEAMAAAITPRTRAVVVPDIFGHAADLDAIMEIAKRHGLVVIEDCAQSPWALYRGRRAGTVGHIGVYSLNYHKHIHTGEGGVCVTADPTLARRMQLIRNHAEAVVGDMGETDLSNMIGFNFRMGEIEAAIGIEQLKKLPRLTARRAQAGQRLGVALAGLPGLTPAQVRPHCSHVYYVYAMRYDSRVTGVPRHRVVAALEAEGLPSMAGYANVHRLPIFQHKIAYGKNGFPWSDSSVRNGVSYATGICPVAERLNDEEFLGLEFCAFVYDDQETDAAAAAIRKVFSCMDDLREA